MVLNFLESIISPEFLYGIRGLLGSVFSVWQLTIERPSACLPFHEYKYLITVSFSIK